MKKITALFFAILMVFSLAACDSQSETSTEGSGTAETPASETAATASGTTEADSTALDAPRLLECGTYSLTNLSSNFTFKYNEDKTVSDSGSISEISLDWTLISGDYYYSFGIFVPETKVHNSKDTVYRNYEVKSAITIDSLSSGSAVKLSTSRDLSNKNQLWRLIPNDDGTFCIAPRLSKSKRLAVKDGQAVIVDYSDGDDISQLKWKFEDMSQSNQFYYEYRSETGNILLRVPLTVFEAKNYTPYFSVKTGKMEKYIPTPEVLQKFADSSQKVYETFYDLTNYRPYYTIIIHAYNYQGVMAGVSGGDHNIYVNCGEGEWFWSDLTKLQYRYQVEEIEDWNFMLLHEMGHMFDWEQQWKFDAESNTNIKVAYVLWKHLGEDVYAAQSGYNFNEYFDGNTITDTWKSADPISLSDGLTFDNEISRNCWIYATYCRDIIGWENARLAYREIHDSGVKGETAYDRLIIYTDALLRHAPEGSITVEEYIGKDEWNATVTKIKEIG